MKYSIFVGKLQSTANQTGSKREIERKKKIKVEFLSRIEQIQNTNERKKD